MRISMLALGMGVTGVVGCGGSTTTVVESTPPPPTVTQVTTAPAAAVPTARAPKPAPVEEAASQEAPDVVGLSLPEAKQQLSAAGYEADVSNTDTTFGILVPRNYTVCTQDPPRGKVVAILAQKYGC
jgi:PASTA domain-containing protein